MKIVIEPAGRWNLSELWQYRELLYFLIWRDLKVRYKQTVIGALWVLLQPALQMVVLTLLFHRFAKLSTEGLPAPLFYYSALLPWTFFANALMQAAQSLVNYQQVLSKVYFPRLFLPLAACGAGLVDFVITALLFIALALFYGVMPELAWLLLLVWTFFLLLLTFALSLWLSALNALFRDVRYAMPFFIQLLMFLSPVVYAAKVVPERFELLILLNPLFSIIEGFRGVLQGKLLPLPPEFLYIHAAIVLTLLVSGALFFQRIEGTLVDRL